jgi:hypothetical protein
MGIYISLVSPFRLQGEELMIDERAIPPAGRIGETEDLIGSVFVKDGKVCHSPGEHEAKGEEDGERGEARM